VGSSVEDSSEDSVEIDDHMDLVDLVEVAVVAF
jgi:hypothetical protein